MYKGRVIVTGEWVTGKLVQSVNATFIVNKYAYEVDPDSVERCGNV